MEHVQDVGVMPLQRKESVEVMLGINPIPQIKAMARSRQLLPVRSQPEKGLHFTEAKYNRWGFMYPWEVVNCEFGIGGTYSGEFQKIQITAVESALDFYVQCHARLDKLKELEVEMSEWYNAMLPRLSHFSPWEIRPGGYYAGFWRHDPDAKDARKGKWVRILVHKKPLDSEAPLCDGAYCALIDHGGVEFFETKDIKLLRRCFANDPWFAVKGQISLSSTVLYQTGFLESSVFLQSYETAKRLNKTLEGMVINTIQGHGPRQDQEDPFPTVCIYIRTVDPECSFLENIYREELQEVEDEKSE